MDITAYSAKLKALDDKINELRTDKEKYKSNQIRENFVNLAIVNDVKCDTMLRRLLVVQKELRELSADHAQIRREFRVLENEYLHFGVRTYDECKPRIHNSKPEDYENSRS